MSRRFESSHRINVSEYSIDTCSAYSIRPAVGFLIYGSSILCSLAVYSNAYFFYPVESKLMSKSILNKRP